MRVIDDDGSNAPKPELSIGDASVEEGGAARFTLTLDTESENPVTVRYRTSNGTARAGSDYDAADDTLTIPAETKTGFIEVQTTEDGDYEVDETFTVTLSSPVGATIGDGNGEGTIEDDDDEPRLSIADVTVEEGRTAEFEVTLDASQPRPRHGAVRDDGRLRDRRLGLHGDQRDADLLAGDRDADHPGVHGARIRRRSRKRPLPSS